MGGVFQVFFLIEASTLFGRARLRLPWSPPPVMWAMPETTFFTLYDRRSLTMGSA